MVLGDLGVPDRRDYQYFAASEYLIQFAGEMYSIANILDQLKLIEFGAVTGISPIMDIIPAGHLFAITDQGGRQRSI